MFSFKEMAMILSLLVDFILKIDLLKKLFLKFSFGDLRIYFTKMIF